MFGLAIAAVIFMCSFLFSGGDATALQCVAAGLPFLWYWHWTWCVIKIGFGLCLGLVGLFAVGALDGKDRVAGLALMALSPLVLVLMCVTSALYIGGVYSLQQGIVEGEVASQQHVIVGCVLYGIGVLFQLLSKSSTSTKKD